MWKPEHNHQIPTGVADLSTVICSDLSAIRFFYGELLGLEEKIWKESSYSVFQLGQTEVMFCQNKASQKSQNTAYDYLDIPCQWSIRVPEALFLGVLYQLKNSKEQLLTNKPEWRHGSYWGVTVNDPVGNPIELYTISQVEPVEKEWETHALTSLL